MPQDPNRTEPARSSGAARKIRRTGSARQGFSPLRNSGEKVGAAERDAIESAASRTAKAIFTGTRTHFRKLPGSTVNGSQSRSSPDFLAWALDTCRADRITGSLYLAGRPGGVLHLREDAVDSSGAPGLGTLLQRSGRITDADWSAVLRADGSTPDGELLTGAGIGGTELRLVATMAAQDGAFAIAAGTINHRRGRPPLSTGHRVPVGAQRLPGDRRDVAHGRRRPARGGFRCRGVTDTLVAGGGRPAHRGRSADRPRGRLRARGRAPRPRAHHGGRDRPRRVPPGGGPQQRRLPGRLLGRPAGAHGRPRRRRPRPDPPVHPRQPQRGRGGGGGLPEVGEHRHALAAARRVVKSQEL